MFAFRHTHGATPEKFGSTIFIKKNAPTVVERELEALISRNCRRYVDIGTVTDAYQPAERKYALMPKILDVFMRHRYPITVLTKSDLVLRDIELWHELSRQKLGVVGLTITTPPSMAKSIASFLEPYAPASEKRLHTVEQLTSAGIGVYIFLDPVVPLLGDDPQGLRELVGRLAEARAKGVFAGVMKLSALTWSLFSRRLAKFKPELVASFEDLYLRRGFKEFGRSSCPPDSYTQQLYQTIQAACTEYGIGFSCERSYHLWTDDCWIVEEPYANPTGYNLWAIIARRKGELVNLHRFLDELRSLNRVTDAQYLDSVVKLWNQGALLKGAHGIRCIQVGGENGEICYTYQP
jgi:DNA repair photolyase